MEQKISSSPPSKSPVDTDDLLNRCLGRMDIVERILTRFQGVLDQDLKHLEDAMQAINAEKVAQIAHRIKGACLAVSAYDLGDCASVIETSANARQLDELPTQLEKLKEQRAIFQEAYPPISTDLSTKQPNTKRFAE